MKKKDKLLHYVSRLKKADLINLASDLHICFHDSSIRVSEMRQIYADAILNHPLDIMAQLPHGDLRLIEDLRDEELSSRNVPALFNYCSNLMYYYGLCDERWDEDGEYWITVPEDMAQAMVQHIDDILNSKDQQLRLGVESIVEGMANLYGLVRKDQVKQTIKKAYDLNDEEVVNELWDTVRDASLLIKWMEWTPGFSADDMAQLPDSEVYYISRHGWISPVELLREIGQRSHLGLDPKDYSDYEIIGAARWPYPDIPNPKEPQFFRFLTEELGLTKLDGYEIAFNLWYRAVHDGDVYFEEGNYTTFFIDEALSWSDRELDMKGLNEAMGHLTEYMNNMPRWVLKGHSPTEVAPMQDITRPPRISLGANMRRMGYKEEDIQRLLDTEWQSMTPFSSIKVPGRNDPCPCGSGKKYKNCHGRDN